MLEEGTFRIHKFKQPIGEERYRILAQGPGCEARHRIPIHPLTHAGVPPVEEAHAAESFADLLAVLEALHRAGVHIVAGTDQVVPGHSLHRELEVYVKAGFTPIEAIQAATLEPARALGLEREAGTIARGKRADLIMVDGDPLADISNLRRVSLVVANGKQFRPAPLWRSVGFEP